LNQVGELVEAEVVRATNLQAKPALGRICHNPADERCNVDHRHEIDRVVPASEHKRSARPFRSVLHQLDPELQEGGRTHNCEWDAAPFQSLLGRVLHAEEFHRTVRCRPDDGYEDHIGSRVASCFDQVDVAISVNARRRDSTLSGEPLDGGHDRVNAGKG